MPTLNKKNSLAQPRRLAAAIAFAFGAGTSVFAAAQATKKVDMNIVAQPLDVALKQIAEAYKLQVVFAPQDVKGAKTVALKGSYTPVEAVAKLASDSGLSTTFNGQDTVVVKPKALGDSSRSPNGGQLENPLQLAQAQNQNNSAGAGAIEGTKAETAGAEAARSTQKPNEGKQARNAERIEVTGSRVRRVEAEGALPVNVYTRRDIERSGQPTIGNFLSTLNEVSMITSETTNGGTVRQSTVQLRGLPVGSTLLLINGRRVQAVGSSSANFFNLNLIPLAAVERIEVLPVGSSAVYGGDALAGTVNIILKKSADGPSIDLRYGAAKGTEDGSVAFTAGGNFERGSFLLLGNVSKTTPLYSGERAFFSDADFRRFGGIDARTRDCTPGTITSATTANLPGLSATFAGIPTNASGRALTIADFAATAGIANLCNGNSNGNGFALVSGNENKAVHATADYRLAGGWSMFGELTYTDDRLKVAESGLSLSNVLVPASNPNNPFGVPVRVTARLGVENGASGFTRNSEFTRALFGLRGEIAAGWDAEATATTTRDESVGVTVNGSANATARTAALASANTATALNPFTIGRAASDDVLDAIWPDTYRNSKGKKDLLNAFVRGPAFSLPAGSVDVIAGAEWARDAYKTATPNSFDFDYKRQSQAVFGEIRAPLLTTTSDSGTKFELATLTLAVRRDNYSDFGNANTHQWGLEVRPIRSMFLRAAAATSFKPPTLLQLNPGESVFATELLGLRDPQRNNAPIIGGEARFVSPLPLQPETGKAQTLGAMWEPEGAAGVRLSLNAWQVKINGLIVQLFPQDILNNEAVFPGFVTRGPSVGGATGLVTRVVAGFVNVGRVEIAGSDWEGAYSLATSAGKLSLSTSASRTSKYQVQIAPGAPLADRLGRRNTSAWAPKWKGRVAAGLDTGPLSVGVTGRYLGAYKDAGTSTRELGDYWLYDLSASLDLKKLAPTFSSTFKTAVLSLGIVNISNKLPEFAGTTQPFYDFTQGDWRGRYANVRLAVGW